MRCAYCRRGLTLTERGWEDSSDSRYNMPVCTADENWAGPHLPTDVPVDLHDLKAVELWLSEA